MVLPGRDMPWKDFALAVKKEWTGDNVGDVAGSLTFYGVLALFPFLLFLVALASLFINPTLAEQLVTQVEAVAPQAVADILGERIHSLGQGGNPGLMTVSVLVAIWAASSGVVSLSRALNVSYGVEENRPFWKVRGIAILATIAAAALSLLAAIAMVGAPPLAAALLGDTAGTVVAFLRLPVAGLLMMFVWAMLYYFLPDVEQRFRFITPGSIIGVVIWLAASWLFSLYVQNFASYDATYGALGGVVVLLLWMWISSQVIMLGAEINSILERQSAEGKRAGAKSQADSGASPGTKEAVGKEEKTNERERLRPVAARPAMSAPGTVGLAFLAGWLVRRAVP